MAKQQHSALLLQGFLQYILVRFLLVQISNWHGFIKPTNSENVLKRVNFRFHTFPVQLLSVHICIFLGEFAISMLQKVYVFCTSMTFYGFVWVICNFFGPSFFIKHVFIQLGMLLVSFTWHQQSLTLNNTELWIVGKNTEA